MKSKNSKILTVFVAVFAVAVLVSCICIFADNDGTSAEIFFRFTDQTGKVVVDYMPVTVTDTDNDGALTINDAFVKAHDAYYPDGIAGYSSASGSYGLYVAKLWGNESGSFGYYVNNQMAMGLSDPIKDGDVLAAYIYQDQTGWSDLYCFFEEGFTMEGRKEGDKITVTLLSVGFDENYMPVNQPVANAAITINGEKTDAVTGADGKAEITLPEGDVIISAASENATIVPPVSKMNVVSKKYEKGMITLPARVLSSEEGLSVTVKLPEDRDNVQSDWIGIYKADADESAITSMDSLGIWCYIGTGTKSYGVAEGKTLELTLDGDLAEVTTWSDGELHWPLAPGEYKVMLFFNDSYTVEDKFFFTVEEDAPDVSPTPEVTQAPDVTAEPDVTNEPDVTDAPKPTDEPAPKKGCSCVIVSSALASAVVLMGAAILISKKKRA